MARSIRSASLETRTARLKLPHRKKPYTAGIGPGVQLGYRRRLTAGRWIVFGADGAGGKWERAFADADDFENSNGKDVLDFWQATDQARALARGEDTASADSGERPVTVAEALAKYRADLETRGADLTAVARVGLHLPPKLAGKPVATLRAESLKQWRDGLREKLAPGSINRIANALRAALNMAADADSRISRHAWEVGLKAVPGAAARNVILSDAQVRRLVAEAYAVGEPLGLLVEVAAVTGARVGQIARLEVGDLQGERRNPRLMMPSSRKGRGEKRVSHYPVAIPETLALKLKQAGKGRASSDTLLCKSDGGAWSKSEHSRPFRRAVINAGLDPSKVSIYALRHSSITRQLLAGVPVRVVAVGHDTSVLMVEKNYSKHIADHTDSLVRPTLLDLGETRANVVPLR
jgi:integrase